MNKKALFLLIAIALIAGGATFYFRNGEKESSPVDDNSSGLIIDSSAIYVAEQKPGNSVIVSMARFEKPGFVVIHEDNVGAPGKILGASSLLASGEAKNLPPIMLSRLTRDSEEIYAMLHFDNGDGKFDAAYDKPVLDKVGNEPMMMITAVSEDAAEPGIVNP